MEKRINKELLNPSDIQNWKSFIESNMLSSSRAGDIFPTFSFLKGKLLTIKSENHEKDFLFSVKEHDYRRYNDYDRGVYNKTRYSGQKPIYFSLTDEDENEHLFGTIVINNEVYLMLSKNDLINLGLSFKTSNELSRNTILKWVNSSDYSNEYTYESDYDDPLCYNSNTGSYMACRDKRYYIYNDLNTIYVKTKKTLFRESSIVDPIFILFKLELQ